jgi:hypothetical protein
MRVDEFFGSLEAEKSKVPLHVRVRKDHMDILKYHLESQGYTLTDFVRIAIKNYLEDEGLIDSD